MLKIISISLLALLVDLKSLEQKKPQRWPRNLVMPHQFKTTTYKYQYDPHLKKIAFDNIRAHKVRYFDSKNNRYGLDSIDGDYIHQRRILYREKVVIDKYNDEPCIYKKLNYEFDIGEYYDYLYDYRTGMLQYKGLVSLPWDRAQIFHAFAEEIQDDPDDPDWDDDDDDAEDDDPEDKDDDDDDDDDDEDDDDDDNNL